MNRWRKVLIAAAGLLLLRAGSVFAISSATINVDVTIIASLSVSVNSTQSSTATVVWNVSAGSTAFTNAASSVTVTNDSGGLTEKWALSTDTNSIDTTGGGQTWAIAASSTNPGADKFAVQAVFGSSNTVAGGCPAAGAATWDSTPVAPLLTTTPVIYTSAVFSEPSLNNNGSPNPDISSGPNDGRMHAGSKRALCWKLVTPTTTSTSHTQNVQIVVTAVTP